MNPQSIQLRLPMSSGSIRLGRVTSCAIFRRGRLLVVRRARGDRFMPGMWELPGGAVEVGETFQRGALRELQEETGLLGLSLRLFRDHEFWSPVRHWQRIRERDYIVRVRSRTPVRIDPTEHTDFAWILESDIDRLKTWPRKRETVRRAFWAEVSEGHGEEPG